MRKSCLEKVAMVKRDCIMLRVFDALNRKRRPNTLKSSDLEIDQHKSKIRDLLDQ